MHLRYFARSAARSQSLREQIRRAGRTRSGLPIWTEEEDAEIRRLYPDYAALKKSLKRRTHSALKNRANRIGIIKRHHCWTDAEVSRLRKLYPTSTAQQLRAAFLGLRKRQIKEKAMNLGLHKKRRSYPSTGFPIIDQIRTRAFVLNLSMLDLDELAGTKNYFQGRGWKCCRSTDGPYSLRSMLSLEMSALFGETNSPLSPLVTGLDASAAPAGGTRAEGESPKMIGA
jgi:hypothetical protein